MRTFNIHHTDGYFLDRNKHGMEKSPGIYIVYRCDYNPRNNTVDVKEVLYIGETDDIYKRHNSATPHEHYEDFVKLAGGEEHICYGTILLPDISEDDRKIIEAAMIHVQQPPINTDHKDHYAKPASDITMTGGPDCWKTKHFIHEHDGDDEIGFDTLMDYLRLNLGSK